MKAPAKNMTRSMHMGHATNSRSPITIANGASRNMTTPCCLSSSSWKERKPG